MRREFFAAAPVPEPLFFSVIDLQLSQVRMLSLLPGIFIDLRLLRRDVIL
jgi:hypothetical protein